MSAIHISFHAVEGDTVTLEQGTYTDTRWLRMGGEQDAQTEVIVHVGGSLENQLAFVEQLAVSASRWHAALLGQTVNSTTDPLVPSSDA